MKTCGLAAAGSASHSFLERLPSLPARLGPVASTSNRLASRIANALRAGRAVKGIDELDACSQIMLCAPGDSLDRMACTLLKAGLDWSGKTVLLCDSGAYTCDIAGFRKQGASLASINSIEGLATHYVIEGDGAALREARLLVRELGGKPVLIASDRVRLWDAGRTLAGSLFTPLLETCTECIRQTGISGPAAAELTKTLMQRSLRAFMHSGRKSWSGPVARSDRAAIDRECFALNAVKPMMGQYFQSAADFAFELHRSFPELTRYTRTSRADGDRK